jgi:hypothetical protein
MPNQSAQESVLGGEPPLVRIVSPAPGAAAGDEVVVAVEATERNGGGIKAVRLYHNGRLVNGPGSLRGIVVEAAVPAQPNALTRRFTLNLVPGANVVRAVGYSRTDVESAPSEISLQWNKPVPVKPVLHVLAVGINQYQEKGLTLRYARPDAEAVAQFFGGAKASGLFREVRVLPLYDATATGTAIKAALNKMASEAKPEDVVFLYLAGHGTTVGLPGDANAQIFYFLPHDVKSGTQVDAIRAGGVSFHDVAEILAKLKAQRVVLVYDACKSGAAVTGGAGNERQALAVLARAQGIHILTASTDQQLAQEDQTLGHGVLTYALLAGLAGKAKYEGSNDVMVRELTGYVERSVRELIEERRLRQQVPMPLNWGPNFALVGTAKP